MADLLIQLISDEDGVDVAGQVRRLLSTELVVRQSS